MRIRLVAAVIFAASLLLLWVLPALAQQQEIVSAGPLTRIITSDTLACQVAHREDEEFEFYPPDSETGSCGTYLSVNETVYGPSGGAATLTQWTAVAQTPIVGSGSSADPYRVVTAVEATDAGIRIEQTDSYVVGTQSYRTDIAITNVGTAGVSGILYRGGDCYLQGDDEGLVTVDNGAPACIVDPTLGRRIEQWTPITAGSHFFAGPYTDVWSGITAQQQFPDTCTCNETDSFDNGAGLSWPVSLGPGQSTVISHETFFSPQGRGPVQQPFKDSVPDPTRISLDPVVVAQSVAIAAGVIVLVPFPSALFNATLEENYAEVMGWVARVRAALAAAWARFTRFVRGEIAKRRAARAGTGDAPGSEATAPVEPIAAPPANVPPGGTSAAAERADFWRSPLGILAFIVLSALLYGFLDPTFGLSLASLATFAGLALGLFVVLIAYGTPLVLFARSRRIEFSIRALPATLLIGVLCVFISRFVNFQPGYLYGLIVGIFFITAVERTDEGRAEAISAASSLTVALVAWIALTFLRSATAGPDDLGNTLLSAATVTVVVAGLENAVFAMLPLRFLPGAAVYAWNRKVWIVILGLGLFGFVHVLLNPTAGYLADTTRTSFLTLVALLVLFGIASVLFWAYFRFRPSRAQPAAE